ncbi:OLC1v1005595C2 [Oldenlandia corymbosa var. corymbosa]|uniref:Aldehyde dehydrogenase n=1 Tax=Oldenlandia corymbosa var. corymbosa TaxID=529605 RepID=A0AAV1DHC5_OLDCO|nr:OLC1v1005595C2 [Oldenlandia corymbosa var. corymbosa]
MKKSLEEEWGELRETFNSGKTNEQSWRRSQLKGLLNLLKEKEEDIFEALEKDLGKHKVEAYRDEVGPLIKSVNYILENLKQWMSSKQAKLPLAAFPSKAELVPEPLGVVLVLSSWNFPFGLSLEPVIGAIAAGNAVVLKPSELSPASSAVLADLIPKYLDNKAIKVIEGGSSVGEQLLELKWDKILFTGSAKVGRIVMSAAVKHLTPVVLELGGKCPTIVDSFSSSRDKEIALNRILSAKFGACAGQACIGVDYIITEKKYAATLVELLKNTLLSMFGENPKETRNISRIINEKNFFRLKSLLDEQSVKDSIVQGGSFDEANLFVEPTILLDPPLDATIMTEEIFGPLLPIITVEKIEDSIQFIKSRPKPLAIYAFTKNEAFKKRLQSETTSGSIVFNDTIIQVSYNVYSDLV